MCVGWTCSHTSSSYPTFKCLQNKNKILCPMSFVQSSELLDLHLCLTVLESILQDLFNFFRLSIIIIFLSLGVWKSWKDHVWCPLQLLVIWWSLVSEHKSLFPLGCCDHGKPLKWVFVFCIKDRLFLLENCNRVEILKVINIRNSENIASVRKFQVSRELFFKHMFSWQKWKIIHNLT